MNALLETYILPLMGAVLIGMIGYDSIKNRSRALSPAAGSTCAVLMVRQAHHEDLENHPHPELVEG